MKNVKQKENKNRVQKIILTWLFIFLVIFILIMYLFSLVGAKSVADILCTRDFWLLIGVLNGILLALYLGMTKVDTKRIVMNENDLENTNWLSIKKLKKMNEFWVTNWKEMVHKKDGIVIGAEKKDGKLEIIMTSQLHALIVGTTGSGKTTGFVDQNISVLARGEKKPSLVITDPKKELYEKHCNQLKKEGYEISVLDLREPYNSARWNPMEVLIRRIRAVKDLENNLQNKDGKYYGGGEIFLSYKDARTRLQELKDEIFENALDLIYTICPLQNKEQPSWEQGARNLILGLLLAFCEDVIKGKMEEKQLLLFNIYHNITKYCSEDTTILKEYLLEKREEFSKVRGLVNTVLITSDKTLTSYLSEVNGYIQQLSDDGILSLTCENDLNILYMDEKPTAVFIIVPDERVTRHRFVTLFITQMYKELVEKANLNHRKKEMETAILKRNTYFVLDEFGNLPKFENMEGIVTVARSRGIRFLFVLQSFSQLTNKYGREVGEIIKSNCNVKIFIGSDDAETRKEFSELCGQKKIKSFSVNTSLENSPSSSTGATNQPLISMGMLERINGDKKGEAIISVRGYEPIWARFTPSFLLDTIYFKEPKAQMDKRDTVLFDKRKYVFDICKNAFHLEDKILDEIEKIEKEETKFAEMEEERIAQLDQEWIKVRNQIDQKIESIASILNSKDAKALKSARLENKVLLLYSFMENYDMTISQKIQIVANNLTEKAFPRLTELQERAQYN